MVFCRNLWMNKNLLLLLPAPQSPWPMNNFNFTLWVSVVIITIPLFSECTQVVSVSHPRNKQCIYIQQFTNECAVLPLLKLWDLWENLQNWTRVFWILKLKQSSIYTLKMRITIITSTVTDHGCARTWQLNMANAIVHDSKDVVFVIALLNLNATHVYTFMKNVGFPITADHK